MPIYEYRCKEGHVQEHYVALETQAVRWRSCETCLHPALRTISAPHALQFFSESRPQIIQAIDPVRPITSPGQHNRLMREQGLEPATQWHARRYHQEAD
jgi:hypothetical protein